MLKRRLGLKVVFISDYHSADQKAKIELIERYQHMFDDSLLRYIAFEENDFTVLDRAISKISSSDFKLYVLKKKLEEQSQNIVFGDWFAKPSETVFVKYKMTTCDFSMDEQHVLSLELLKTDSEYANQGHARFLLTAIVQAAKQAKIPLNLTVSPKELHVDKEKLIKFYRSVGFTFSPNTAKKMEINW
ncbi:GNAT family N-acetyltransferase [Photobacterium leiognathi]|uniref:GNAT family N-acetyltransferase n=1 Tax=Photobacterium leiognathi TaxID=553611 RepID=UPI002981BA3E|nr:hypothetical protein [Photobacterium leiognathi]